MMPLVRGMVHGDPLQRPTMEQVVEKFSSIRRSLGFWKLRSRAIVKDEDEESFKYVIDHWFRRIYYILLCLPAISTLKS